MPTTCFHTPYTPPADSGDQAWPCIPLLSPELLCSGELGKTFRDPYWWDFHCSVSFCWGGGAHKHFWVFHLRQYAVFTPLSIERRVVPAAAPNRHPAGRRSVLSLAGSRSDQSLPSAQPEPAETRYPHCHVFRLTIWNNTEEDTRTERHKSSHVRDELGVRERSLFPSDEPRGV